MRKLATFLMTFATVLMALSCDHNTTNDEPEPTPGGYVEREPFEVLFTNIDVAYVGDDVGDHTSDGWLIKLYTDMEIDPQGNPIGPGYVAQLLVNAPYDSSQSANTSYLKGIYSAQYNSGNFNPGTFVSGYGYTIDLPGQQLEIVDGTFWGELADQSTTIDYDLIDDGVVEISGGGDNFSLSALLVGQKCTKRRFLWSGAIEPHSYVEPEVANSTLEANKELNELVQLHIEDRGDIYKLGDGSYRCFSLFLSTSAIDCGTGRPAGNGEFLRLDLLVPGQSNVGDGIPSGTYVATTRNEDSSIDREKLVPYTLIPGMPNRFVYPYWAGSWYVSMEDGQWGEEYARIDAGEVSVVRGEDGSHRIVCTLEDSSPTPWLVSAEVVVAEFEVIN